MESTECVVFLRPLVRSLGRRARLERSVPESVTSQAERATLVRFSNFEGVRLDSSLRRRVGAYFWAVVRRRAVRGAPSLAREMVRTAVARDLAQAGWNAAAIEAELTRAGLGA